jgi:hypothetical protein
MSCSEVGLKVGPCMLGNETSVPVMTGFRENVGVKNGNNLLWQVWGLV